MSDSEPLDLVDESQYRDTDEMIHEYKVKQLRTKKQKLVARRDARLFKKKQRGEILAEKREIRGLRREQMRERVAPVRKLAGGLAGGMSRAGAGFARGMAKKPSGGAPQPRGMFSSQGSSSSSGKGLSLLSGGSKLSLSLGGGRKKPLSFRRSGGMSLSLLSHGSGKRRKKRRKR